VTHSPCADRKNDPQDWFIRQDGKQYPDDIVLTEAERAGVARSVLRIGGETFEEHEARIARAINAAVNNRKRAALIRRRQAKDLCWSGCPIREGCLAQALERGEMHGTWGGYLEEELVQIRRRRGRRRQQHQPLETTPL
jgi:hypothetical protein